MEVEVCLQHKCCVRMFDRSFLNTVSIVALSELVQCSPHTHTEKGEVLHTHLPSNNTVTMEHFLF